MMALFALGNMLLKLRRASLPRPESAGWGGLLITGSAILVAVLKAMVYLLKYISDHLFRFIAGSKIVLVNTINKINAQEFVYFSKGDDVAVLNKVMRYGGFGPRLSGNQNRIYFYRGGMWAEYH